MAEARYPRDLYGYGRNPPDPCWPGGGAVRGEFRREWRDIMSHEKVWVPTRLQIAQHWHANLCHLAANAFDIGS
jgi:hypothetical protein